jgi:L-iditol 2-dehydrogenase
VKAAFLVGCMHFEVRDVPDPATPPNGLVLKVAFCGICGSDLRRWGEGPLNGQPIIPGHEFSGVVESVGAEVKNYRVGDRLAVAPDVHCGECYYCQRGLYNLCNNLHLIGITPGYPGGLAEKVVLTAEILSHGIVNFVPEALSLEEGALAEPCSAVLASHQNLGTNANDTVVVMGGGPIGCLHTAVARSRGARVILSEPNPLRRKMAASFGPDVTIDPVAVDVVAQVYELTANLGADIVICANPFATTQTQAVELVRKRGRVVLFGGLPDAQPFTKLDANKIHYGEIQVIGSFSYTPSVHAQALQALLQRQIRSEDIISRTINLDEISMAFQIAAAGEVLKVLIKM